MNELFEKTDLFEIADRDSWLKMFINIEHKIVIDINEFYESDSFFSSDEEDGEWYSAGISLDKDKAVKLRDKLNAFISKL